MKSFLLTSLQFLETHMVNQQFRNKICSNEKHRTLLKKFINLPLYKRLKLFELLTTQRDTERKPKENCHISLVHSHMLRKTGIPLVTLARQVACTAKNSYVF